MRRHTIPAALLLTLLAAGRSWACQCVIRTDQVAPAIMPHSVFGETGYGHSFIDNAVGGPVGPLFCSGEYHHNLASNCNFDAGTTVAVGDWNCTYTGLAAGPHLETLSAVWHFKPSEGATACSETCSCEVSYRVVWDLAPPRLSWSPDPGGLILSSTDQILVTATDDVELARLDADYGTGWQNTVPPPYTVGNRAYHIYTPDHATGSTSISLQGLSGPVTVAASALDYADRRVDEARHFTVDSEGPKVAIDEPPAVSFLGQVGAVSGTASDDTKVEKVALRVQDYSTGKWWDGAGFNAGSEVDFPLTVAPGAAVSWSYAGLSAAVLPRTDAVWLITAKATDAVGRTAETTAVMVIVAKRKARLLQDYDTPPSCSNRPGPRVDPDSGQFAYTSRLIHLPGGSPALDLALTFTSSGPVDSAWGRGWVNVNDQTLRLRQAGALLWNDGAGNQRNYFPPKTGDPNLFTTPVQTFTTLRVTGRDVNGKPASAELREKDGTVTNFQAVAGTTTFVMTRLIDRNGNPVDYTHDGVRVTRAQDGHRRYLQMTYANGRVAQVDDSGGRTVAYGYDADGYKTSETGPEGTTSFAYDTSTVRLTTITYPNGGLRVLRYDAQGRVLNEASDGGQDGASYRYFASSTVITDARGVVTTREYLKHQGLRLPTRIHLDQDPADRAVTFEYDAAFNMRAQADTRLGTARTTRYEYDNGNVTRVEDPVNGAGAPTVVSYDGAFNQPTRVQDPDNHPTTLGYDPANGNLQSVAVAVGGRPLTTTLGRYDAGGHPHSVTDPSGLTTNLDYDANGQLTTVTDPMGRTTTLTRDPAGRVTDQAAPGRQLGQFDHTLFAYGTDGNLQDVTDNMGGVTHYDYAPGRESRLLSKVTDARQNALGPAGKGTSFGYDPQGRLTSVTAPDSAPRTLRYNADSTLDYTVNARGQRTDFVYDAKGRLTSRTISGEGAYTYGYDGADRTTSLTAPNGASETRAYDDLDRLTRSVQTIPGVPGSFAIGYDYDANGNRLHMTTPWGTFSYVPDELNRVSKITDPNNRSFSFVYDDAGRRARLVRDIGVDTGYAYDDAGRLLGSTSTRVLDGLVVSSVAYGYDNAGNRTAMTDYRGTHLYGYDALNRLISARHPDGLETFDYDKAGNRLADALAAGYQYDAANRLRSNSLYDFVPDADGNVISRTEKAGGRALGLQYDAQNQLTGALTPDGGQVEFRLDASGRRIEKGVSAAQTRAHYVYDGEKLLAMVDDAGGLLALFTNGPGIAETLKMQSARSGELFYFVDGLGSVTALTNASGDVVERVSYKAYGLPTFADMRGPTAVYSDRSWTDSPWGFGGMTWDPEIGLNHAERRDQDPNSGRFVQEDPIGFQGGTNLLEYVHSNPTSRRDPRGLEWEISASLSGSFGGVVLLGLFPGAGASISVTSSGQIIIQGQRSISLGTGLYAGYGIQFGVTHNKCAPEPGLSVSNSVQADVNAGFGPSVGATIQGAPGNFSLQQSGFPPIKFGGGVGIQVSAGATQSVTYVTPSAFRRTAPCGCQ